MKRILRGSVLLAVTAILGACSSESGPTKDGTADHIVATPSSVLIAQGDSQPILIRLVDQQGTSMVDPVTITTVGAGLTVVADSAFRPIFDAGDSLVFNPNGTELRVYAKASEDATQLLPWSFTVSSGGKTLEIPVTIYPRKDQAFAFSNLTPALAEVITITPNTGIRFSSTSKVTFPSGPAPRVLSVSPDGTSMTAIVAPNNLGPATFSDVTVPYNTNLKFSLSSTDIVTGVKIDTFFVTASNLTPAANQPITVAWSGANTPANLFRFDASTAFANGANPAVLLHVSPDSLSADILPQPGANDYIFANGALVDSFRLSLTTNVSIHAGDLTHDANTDAFATAPTINAPALGDRVAKWEMPPFGFDDSGNFGPGGVQLYKLVVSAADSLNFTLDPIGKGADLGVYIYDNTFSLTGDAVDGVGAGSGSNLESGDIAFAPGTYYIGVVYFQYAASPQPPDKYLLTITGLK